MCETKELHTPKLIVNIQKRLDTFVSKKIIIITITLIVSNVISDIENSYRTLSYKILGAHSIWADSLYTHAESIH